MITDRIRKVRDHFNMSRKGFGEEFYVSQDVINNLERGRVQPTELNIKAICETYNVNENWLRTGEGEMFNPASKSLDALAKKNNIDDLTRAVVTALLEMSPAQRDAFTSLVHNIANKVQRAEHESAEAMAVDAVIGYGAFNSVRTVLKDEDSQEAPPSEPQI